jgi:hypothetical protein
MGVRTNALMGGTRMGPPAAMGIGRGSGWCREYHTVAAKMTGFKATEFQRQSNDLADTAGTHDGIVHSLESGNFFSSRMTLTSSIIRSSTCRRPPSQECRASGPLVLSHLGDKAECFQGEWGRIGIGASANSLAQERNVPSPPRDTAKSASGAAPPTRH